mgnify:CR=1 FL=1
MTRLASPLCAYGSCLYDAAAPWAHSLTLAILPHSDGARVFCNRSSGLRSKYEFRSPSGIDYVWRADSLMAQSALDFSVRLPPLEGSLLSRFAAYCCTSCFVTYWSYIPDADSRRLTALPTGRPRAPEGPAACSRAVDVGGLVIQQARLAQGQPSASAGL